MISLGGLLSRCLLRSPNTGVSPAPVPWQVRFSSDRENCTMIRRIPSVAFAMALAFGFAVAQPALASSPSLGGISPRGMERGKTVELTFSGGRLTDAKSLLFYTPGLRLVGLKVVNDATVKATVEASPSCALGNTQCGCFVLRAFPNFALLGRTLSHYRRKRTQQRIHQTPSHHPRRDHPRCGG